MALSVKVLEDTPGIDGAKLCNDVCQISVDSLQSMGVLPGDCQTIMENVLVMRQSFPGFSRPAVYPEAASPASSMLVNMSRTSFPPGVGYENEQPHSSLGQHPESDPRIMHGYPRSQGMIRPGQGVPGYPSSAAAYYAGNPGLSIEGQSRFDPRRMSGGPRFDPRMSVGGPRFDPQMYRKQYDEVHGPQHVADSILDMTSGPNPGYSIPSTGQQQKYRFGPPSTPYASPKAYESYGMYGPRMPVPQSYRPGRPGMAPNQMGQDVYSSGQPPFSSYMASRSQMVPTQRPVGGSDMYPGKMTDGAFSNAGQMHQGYGASSQGTPSQSSMMRSPLDQSLKSPPHMGQSPVSQARLIQSPPSSHSSAPPFTSPYEPRLKSPVNTPQRPTGSITPRESVASPGSIHSIKSSGSNNPYEQPTIPSLQSPRGQSVHPPVQQSVTPMPSPYSSSNAIMSPGQLASPQSDCMMAQKAHHVSGVGTPAAEANFAKSASQDSSMNADPPGFDSSLRSPSNQSVGNRGPVVTGDPPRAIHDKNQNFGLSSNPQSSPVYPRQSAMSSQGSQYSNPMSHQGSSPTAPNMPLYPALNTPPSLSRTSSDSPSNKPKPKRQYNKKKKKTEIMSGPLESLHRLTMFSDNQVVDPKSVVRDAYFEPEDKSKGDLPSVVTQFSGSQGTVSASPSETTSQVFSQSDSQLSSSQLSYLSKIEFAEIVTGLPDDQDFQSNIDMNAFHSMVKGEEVDSEGPSPSKKKKMEIAPKEFSVSRVDEISNKEDAGPSEKILLNANPMSLSDEQLKTHKQSPPCIVQSGTFTQANNGSVNLAKSLMTESELKSSVEDLDVVKPGFDQPPVPEPASSLKDLPVQSVSSSTANQMQLIEHLEDNFGGPQSTKPTAVASLKNRRRVRNFITPRTAPPQPVSPVAPQMVAPTKVKPGPKPKGSKKPPKPKGAPKGPRATKTKKGSSKSPRSSPTHFQWEDYVLSNSVDELYNQSFNSEAHSISSRTSTPTTQDSEPQYHNLTTVDPHKIHTIKGLLECENDVPSNKNSSFQIDSGASHKMVSRNSGALICKEVCSGESAIPIQKVDTLCYDQKVDTLCYDQKVCTLGYDPKVNTLGYDQSVMTTNSKGEPIMKSEYSQGSSHVDHNLTSVQNADTCVKNENEQLQNSLGSFSDKTSVLLKSHNGNCDKSARNNAHNICEAPTLAPVSDSCSQVDKSKTDLSRPHKGVTNTSTNDINKLDCEIPPVLDKESYEARESDITNTVLPAPELERNFHFQHSPKSSGNGLGTETNSPKVRCNTQEGKMDNTGVCSGDCLCGKKGHHEAKMLNGLHDKKLLNMSNSHSTDTRKFYNHAETKVNFKENNFETQIQCVNFTRKISPHAEMCSGSPNRVQNIDTNLQGNPYNSVGQSATKWEHDTENETLDKTSNKSEKNVFDVFKEFSVGNTNMNNSSDDSENSIENTDFADWFDSDPESPKSDRFCDEINDDNIESSLHLDTDVTGPSDMESNCLTSVTSKDSETNSDLSDISDTESNTLENTQSRIVPKTIRSNDVKSEESSDVDDTLLTCNSETVCQNGSNNAVESSDNICEDVISPAVNEDTAEQLPTEEAAASVKRSTEENDAKATNPKKECENHNTQKNETLLPSLTDNSTSPVDAYCCRNTTPGHPKGQASPRIHRVERPASLNFARARKRKKGKCLSDVIQRITAQKMLDLPNSCVKSVSKSEHKDSESITCMEENPSQIKQERDLNIFYRLKDLQTNILGDMNRNTVVTSDLDSTKPEPSCCSPNQDSKSQFTVGSRSSRRSFQDDFVPLNIEPKLEKASELLKSLRSSSRRRTKVNLSERFLQGLSHDENVNEKPVTKTLDNANHIKCHSHFTQIRNRSFSERSKTNICDNNGNNVQDENSFSTDENGADICGKDENSNSEKHAFDTKLSPIKPCLRKRHPIFLFSKLKKGLLQYEIEKMTRFERNKVNDSLAVLTKRNENNNFLCDIPDSLCRSKDGFDLKELCSHFHIPRQELIAMPVTKDNCRSEGSRMSSNHVNASSPVVSPRKSERRTDSVYKSPRKDEGVAENGFKVDSHGKSAEKPTLSKQSSTADSINDTNHVDNECVSIHDSSMSEAEVIESDHSYVKAHQTAEGENEKISSIEVEDKDENVVSSDEKECDINDSVKQNEDAMDLDVSCEVIEDALHDYTITVNDSASSKGGESPKPETSDSVQIVSELKVLPDKCDGQVPLKIFQNKAAFGGTQTPKNDIKLEDEKSSGKREPTSSKSSGRRRKRKATRYDSDSFSDDETKDSALNMFHLKRTLDIVKNEKRARKAKLEEKSKLRSKGKKGKLKKNVKKEVESPKHAKGPIVKVKGPMAKPRTCKVLNFGDENDVKKSHYIEGLAPPPSYSFVNEMPFVCSLCGHPSNYQGLGDLFGPYSVNGTIRTGTTVSAKNIKLSPVSAFEKTKQLVGTSAKVSISPERPHRNKKKSMDSNEWECSPTRKGSRPKKETPNNTQNTSNMTTKKDISAKSKITPKASARSSESTPKSGAKKQPAKSIPSCNAKSTTNQTPKNSKSTEKPTAGSRRKKLKGACSDRTVTPKKVVQGKAARGKKNGATSGGGTGLSSDSSVTVIEGSTSWTLMSGQHSPPRVARSLVHCRQVPTEVWVHEDCVVWTSGVYISGVRISGLEEALSIAAQTVCSVCKLHGATIGCFSKACGGKYHYLCARKQDCFFEESNYSLFCPKHKTKKVKALTDE